MAQIIKAIFMKTDKNQSIVSVSHFLNCNRMHPLATIIKIRCMKIKNHINKNYF